MKQFFGALLGSIVGLFLLLAIGIGFAVGAASSSDEAAITLSDKTVVHIELSGTRVTFNFTADIGGRNMVSIHPNHDVVCYINVQ